MNNLAIVAFIAFVSVLSISMRITQAGPILEVPRINRIYEQSYNVRNKREIYPEILSDEPEKVEDNQPEECVVGDLVYEIDEAVPADQPCLKCKCQPPGVHCEATRCEKKPGCRAIHKPNTCCPEYQCECDYEGKTYGNGERLEQKAGTECKVCYCRGGEVQCAEVSCYIRNDCEAHKVPGKCCPKYDHCPPKEPSSVFYTNANEINETNKSQHREQENVQNGEETPKITIQEIIPEIKEIPITNSPKREINEVHTAHGHLLVEEDTEENVTNNNNSSNELDNIPDAESDSSELAEVYQQPPPVLRIGDKLLFLKKDGELVSEKDDASTPATVITIIGAEGLQRGFEESLENHEGGNNNNKNEKDKSELGVSTVESDDEDDMQTVAESTYILSLVNRPTTEAETSIITDENTERPNVNSTDLLFPLDDTGNFTDLDVNSDGASNNSTEFSSSSEFGTTSEVSVSSLSSISTTTTTTTTAIIAEKDEIIESNPEYPPIPDVMTQQVEEIDTQTQNAEGQLPKILPEVYEVRSNDSSNKANASSGANTSWLKKTLLNPAATLPDSILSSVAESDSTSIASTDVDTETTSITPTPMPTPVSTETTLVNLPSNNRSIETMESLEVIDDSGETVTQTNDHASILNDENESNASVEDLTSTSGDTAELVEMVPGYENMTIESLEVETSTSTTSEIKNPDEVEMIDVALLRGHSDEEAKNATHAVMIEDRKIGKRESSEDDKIFEELDREIRLDTGLIVEDESHEDQEKQAKAIFKELVDEATSNTTPKPVNLQGSEPQNAQQHAQAQALQRIGDALSKFQLRDSKKSGSVDGNVLGILRDFFTAQYRAYN